MSGPAKARSDPGSCRKEALRKMPRRARRARSPISSAPPFLRISLSRPTPSPVARTYRGMLPSATRFSNLLAAPLGEGVLPIREFVRRFLVMKEGGASAGREGFLRGFVVRLWNSPSVSHSACHEPVVCSRGTYERWLVRNHASRLPVVPLRKRGEFPGLPAHMHGIAVTPAFPAGAGSWCRGRRRICRWRRRRRG